jgi:hypothetical protein
LGHRRWAAVLAVAMTLATTACSATFSPASIPSTGVAGALRSESAGAYRVAPYVDMGSSPSPQLATYAAQTGTTYYTMAFMQAYEGDRCEAAWFGSVPARDPSNGPYLARQLAAIRNAGGDAILSFGGAAGTDLADVCPDATSLASAYEEAIGYYHFTHVDFDIEGNNPYDAASIARRSQALEIVQRHAIATGHPIVLSYTLPVLPAGLPGHVLGVVQSAVKAGIKLAIVNVMTMDFGNGAAPHPQGRMGTYAIDAAVQTVKQLKTIGFPFGSNPYASIGITPMIGVNDVSDEIFEPSDAAKLVKWAAENGVGRLSFWAQQRDKECPHGDASPRSASDTCSGIVQAPYAFGKLFATL